MGFLSAQHLFHFDSYLKINLNRGRARQKSPCEVSRVFNSGMKTHRRVTAKSIPDEVIDDVLSKLPAKCIARCRCVSKNWDSIIGRTYFKDRFLARSLSRPQLLFACLKEGHVYFFSSPQPLGLADNSLLTADYLMKIPFYGCEFVFERRCSSLKGLILLRDTSNLEGKDHLRLVICNPSIGKSMTLPKLKTRRKVGVKSYLGYDPIEKQHKVLAMTWKTNGIRQRDSEEHQVMTLGTRELSWRMIECFIPHTPHPNYSHTCINGVLYYSARLDASALKYMIVCFDVRSEKFSFVDDTNTSNSSLRRESLINYNGKLGSLGFHYASIKLRVLEDKEKQEWSEYIFELDTPWRHIIGDKTFRLIGVNLNNEIVLSPTCQTVPFCIFYCNIERNTIRRVKIQRMEGMVALFRRVKIQGMEGTEDFKDFKALNGQEVYTYQDHIEDLKPLML